MALGTLKITYCGLFSALIAVCSWISVPSAIPFTLQSFGVFLSFFVLGGKYGTVSYLVYLLLGAVGLPVFSSFRGGVGTLFSQTGGYLWGFVLGGIVVIFFEKVLRKNTAFKYVTGIILLFVTYLAGTLWYFLMYGEGAGFFDIFEICVIPFVIPDLVKLLIAVRISKRVKYVDLMERKKYN